MKKVAKLLAVVAALSLSLAAFGFSACDEEEDEGTPMTEEDVQVVNTAFNAANSYSGGFTINETSSSVLTWDNSMLSDYEGAISATAAVTYDESSGNMAYTATSSGTGIYAEIYDIDAGYYTIKNSDTSYTQYEKLVWEWYSNTNYRSYSTYTAAPADGYYTSFGSCIQDVFNLDLSAAANAETAAEYALIFEDMIDEQVSLLADNYGITVTFNAGSCTTWLDGEDTVYRFKANATASTTVTSSGVTVTVNDNLNYTVDIYLDTSDTENVTLEKIDMELVQKLSSSAEGITMTATMTTNMTDEFTYAYDSSLMPADFSEYTAA